MNDIQSFANTHKYSINEWEIIGSKNTLNIVTANIELTLKCELNCSYCYVNAGQNVDHTQELTNNDWNKVIDWLIANNIKLVTLTGGNPTLSDSFWTIVDKLTASNIYIRIFTNGISINKKVLERLIKSNIVFIEVSLDSINAHIHNQFRNNSYKDAINAIELLSKSNLKLGIGCCIYKSNIDELPKLAKYAYKKNAILRFGTINCKGRGRFMKNHFLSPIEMCKLNDIISMLNYKYPNLYFDDFDDKYMKMHGKCDFYYGIITINHQGRLKPCLLSDDFFYKFVPWAILDHKCWEIKDIFELDNYLKIKKINTTYLADKKKCNNCKDLCECSGCLLSGYSCKIKKGGNYEKI